VELNSEVAVSKEKLNKESEKENEIDDIEEDDELENSEEWDEAEVEVYTLEDEEGSESEFTLIKRMDINGQSYVAFEPFSEDDDSTDNEEDSFVILKVVNEDGEEVFITIEDDEEFDKVADIFEDELMSEMEEYENDDDDEDTEDN
jgi:uncharacterized protein YrzB (UPF0473 family)